MSKKEKTASIILSIAMVLLIISSVCTVVTLKIQKNNLVKELIEKY